MNNSVLRFTVAGTEQRLVVDRDDLTSSQLQALQLHIKKRYFSDVMVYDVRALDWSAVRHAYTLKGTEKQRHEGARKVVTNQLIDAPESSLAGVLQGCAANIESLERVPIYREPRGFISDFHEKISRPRIAGRA